MSAQTVRESLRGVAVGLLTPYDENNNVDHRKIRENAEALFRRGCRTFLSAANISEYHSLSRTERTEVVETCVESLPTEACVLAGVGGNTSGAIELIEEYDRIGTDAMMIMSPDHTYLHERGILEYYRKLGARTTTPLVPYIRGFDPSLDFLVDLTALESVVGIKYAIKDTVKLGAAVEEGNDSTVWINGLAEPLSVSTWAEGAEGFTAGVSNFRPEVGFALHEALRTEHWERARRIRNLCLPFQNFRGEVGHNNTIPGAVSVPTVKKGLELAGLHGGTVREPIKPLSREDTRHVEQLYEQLDRDIENIID